MTDHVDHLERRLTEACRGDGTLIVAFSGGVDSALLAVAAARARPGRVVAATARSASLASGELDHCRGFADEWQIPWRAVDTRELDDERYLVNDSSRCFWCKSALMDALDPLSDELDATVVLGVNVDDLGDHRPGQDAAAQRGARFPFVDAGFGKADVRALARAWGLDVWDRPAMPCLASRIPYHTPVSVNLLSRVDRAEAGVRALGFDDVRVRHYDTTARVEIPRDDFARCVDRAEEIVAAVAAAGYDYVTLDLAGLRSGNLNRALTASERSGS